MSGTQTLCCHVNTATLMFAIYYLVFLNEALFLCNSFCWCWLAGERPNRAAARIENVLRGVDIILKVLWDQAPYSVTHHGSKVPQGQRVFDISTNILTLVMMSLSAVLVLFSRRKGPMFVLPFVLMVFVELALSFLSLFDGAWSLPGTPSYRDTLQHVKSQKKLERLNEEDVGQFTMWYTVLFMLDIMLKVYILQVSMKCFYALKAERITAIHVDAENTATVKLPSYDEALRMKAEDTPPCYQEP